MDTTEGAEDDAEGGGTAGEEDGAAVTVVMVIPEDVTDEADADGAGVEEKGRVLFAVCEGGGGDGSAPPYSFESWKTSPSSSSLTSESPPCGEPDWVDCTGELGMEDSAGFSCEEDDVDAMEAMGE